jgi:histidinol phosphatase-like PHP family hydrolase
MISLMKILENNWSMMDRFLTMIKNDLQHIILNQMKRTNFFLNRLLTLIICLFPIITLRSQQPDPFPLIDLHVHIKGDLSLDEAVKKSRRDHIQYGVVVNCGQGFPVHSDFQIDSFLVEMKKYPQFFIGMQAEGREWVKMFSKEAIAKFDYVFTDAMTFTDDKGRRNRIWIKAETWIENEEKFMDNYVKTIVKIMNNEPINIYVNPTFLPEQMAGRYDSFWSEKRMDAVIEAAKKKGIAIEINNRYKIPSEKFISRAKLAGVKFTIGTNNTNSNFSRAEYALEIIRKCGLTESDFYKPVKKLRTLVTIRGEQFFINGQPTYPGRYWKGNKIEGLLLNSRMVQGIFDDLNQETRSTWIYPDTRTWDPSRNTNEFIINMKKWSDYGLLAFTINLQGGSPQGYSSAQPWYNSAYNEDGSLRSEYMNRLEKILNKADELCMVPILGFFYFGQDERLKSEAAIRNAVDNVLNWLFVRGYKNILIEINNECNVNKYDHEILKPARVHELIELVKQKNRNGFRFYAGTSYGGKFIPLPNVVTASDFILIHGNGESNPDNILAMVKKTREVQGYTPKPVLFNEDDHFDFDKEWNNFTAAIKGYASWGYFDYRMKDEPFESGYQSVPVDWGINSDRKKSFFNLLKEITGY